MPLIPLVMLMMIWTNFHPYALTRSLFRASCFLLRVFMNWQTSDITIGFDIFSYHDMYLTYHSYNGCTGHSSSGSTFCNFDRFTMVLYLCKSRLHTQVFPAALVKSL